VVELLAIKIRNNESIKCIQLKMQCIKISQMADDTCLFLKDIDSISKALGTLNDFETVSGLKTNIEKDKGIQS